MAADLTRCRHSVAKVAFHGFHTTRICAILPLEEERKKGHVALNIKSAQADRLARTLAAETGESITEAVTKALAERLARCRRGSNPARREAIHEIRARVSALPLLDDRSAEAILGYNSEGTFG